MSIWAIIVIFIGLNIDTFIALLFVLPRYNYQIPLLSFTSATVILWLFGVLIGKGMALLFPNWITGFLGILLLYLALTDRGNKDRSSKASFTSLFLLCLSLGGDNLAFYVPWVTKLSISAIWHVSLVFVIGSVFLIIIGKTISSARPITYVLEKYGAYLNPIVYSLAGIYIIAESHLIAHLVKLTQLLICRC